MAEISTVGSALQGQIGENERLRALRSEPQISPLEKERLDFVKAQLWDFNATHIAVLKYILRQGKVEHADLVYGKEVRAFADENAINHVLSRGVQSGLLNPATGRSYVSFKEQFLLALEFFLHYRPVTPPQA